ncbi:MAG: hypothetical protein RR643_04960 [Anaerorhabdus sp.]|uniref:hypothetical protein n=1 Tax=Anaerorhabdus sp. TaxID=1872524 RepID=UPI002FC5EEE8
MKNLLTKTVRAAFIGMEAAGNGILSTDTLIVTGTAAVIATAKSGDFKDGIKAALNANVAMMAIHGVTAILLDSAEQAELESKIED